MKRIGLLVITAVMAFGRIIDVADHGAVPNDGIDDAPAIRKAIAAAAALPSSIIVLHAGQYHITGETIPASIIVRGITIREATNITIEGNGAELIGNNIAAMFYIERSQGVRIRNLSIDYDPPPFGYGMIDKKGADHIDVRTHQGQEGKYVEILSSYDPVTRLIIPGTNYKDIYQLYWRERTTSWVSPGIMRIPVFKNQTPNIPKVPGPAVLFRFSVYNQDAFRLMYSSDITLEDIAVHASCGIGVYGWASRDITIRGMTIAARTGKDRMLSTSGDATHFRDCRGSLTIERSRFENMADDGINVHTQYLEVASRIDDTTIVLWTAQYMIPTQGVNAIGDRSVRDPKKMAMPEEAMPGDILEFGTRESPLNGAHEAAVISCTADRSAKTITVRTAKPLPAWITGGTYTANTSNVPRVTIRGCYYGKNRAGGIILMCRDAIVEDSVIESTSGNAIRLSADRGRWYEGIGARNIVIRRNIVRGCHSGLGAKDGAIALWAEVDKKRSGAGVHRNIVIEDNVIIGTGLGAAISVGSAYSVRITGNTIIDAPVGIAVIESRGIGLTGNTIQATERVNIDGSAAEVNDEMNTR